MTNKSGDSLGTNGALALVAFICATASAGIAFIAVLFLKEISDTGMLAIALMSMAPAALGIGIAYFIYRSARMTGAWQGDRPDKRENEGFREGWPS